MYTLKCFSKISFNQNNLYNFFLPSILFENHTEKCTVLVIGISNLFLRKQIILNLK